MKKLGKFINNNIVGFILGAIIFGGSAAVIAGTVASSNITYTNNSQSNVEGALNDLYVKANNVPYKYWTDNYSGYYYAEGSVPSTVYTSYRNFITSGTDQPFIRTSYVNESPDKHSACLYLGSTNKVFCLDYGFWEVVTGTNTSSTENGERVKTSLKVAMEKALGTSTTSCSSASGAAYCDVGSASCHAYSSGYVYCYDGVSLDCGVDSDGEAYCNEE